MKKRWIPVLALLGAVSMMTACGKEEKKEEVKEPTQVEQPVDKENQEKLDMINSDVYTNVRGLSLQPGSTISLIGRLNNTAYWKTLRQGAEDAVAEINAKLGYEGADKIRLVYSAPEEEDGIDEQVNILDEELSRYPSALAIAAVDEGAYVTQFDLATENGIPIVAVDTGTDYYNIASLVETDNEKAAKKAADQLAGMMDESKKVIVVVQDKRSTTAIERKKAFRKQMKNKHPEVEIVEVFHLNAADDIQEEMRKKLGVEVDENEEDVVTEYTNEEVMQYLLEKHPDVEAVYMTTESCAEVACGVIDKMGLEDLKVVGFDGGEEQMKRLENGQIDGLIVQNPYGIGYATVVASARAILRQGNESVVDTGYVWVTTENMNDELISKQIY